MEKWSTVPISSADIADGFLKLVVDSELKLARPQRTYQEIFQSRYEVQMSSALDEFKKPVEEWARAIIDGKSMENLLILYKLLYALGCRIDGIDHEEHLVALRVR